MSKAKTGRAVQKEIIHIYLSRKIYLTWKPSCKQTWKDFIYSALHHPKVVQSGSLIAEPRKLSKLYFTFCKQPHSIRHAPLVPWYAYPRFYPYTACTWYVATLSSAFPWCSARKRRRETTADEVNMSKAQTQSWEASQRGIDQHFRCASLCVPIRRHSRTRKLLHHPTYTTSWHHLMCAIVSHKATTRSSSFRAFINVTSSVYDAKGNTSAAPQSIGALFSVLK